MPFLKDKCKLVSRSKKLEHITKKSGLHHAVFTVSGNKYIGDWSNNLKDGKGSISTKALKLYETDWNKNHQHGFGLLALQQANKVFILEYRGDWIQGKECGLGTRHYPDGSYFVGHWKNGERYGYGQMWYADGAFYDGEWAKDQRHGEGMLVRTDGNRYEGGWTFDLKHGKGRLFYLHTGQMQEGIWQNDICVYSFIIDIPFRQTALQPTPYPIYRNELLNLEDVCKEQETKALTQEVPLCI